LQSYNSNLSLYFLLKLEGAQIEDHPVVGEEDWAVADGLIGCRRWNWEWGWRHANRTVCNRVADGHPLQEILPTLLSLNSSYPSPSTLFPGPPSSLLSRSHVAVPRRADRLIYLRTVLEKIRPIDKKLKYQVDKVIRAGVATVAEEGRAQVDPMSFKPNPENLTAKVGLIEAPRWMSPFK